MWDKFVQLPPQTPLLEISDEGQGIMNELQLGHLVCTFIEVVVAFSGSVRPGWEEGKQIAMQRLHAKSLESRNEHTVGTQITCRSRRIVSS